MWRKTMCRWGRGIEAGFGSKRGLCACVSREHIPLSLNQTPLPMTSYLRAREGKKSERQREEGHCRGEGGNQEETAHGA